MNKILLIIKREYLTRVRKKSFIIMTFLGPLLMSGVIGGAAYLAINNGETTEQVKIIDETPGKYFQKKLKSDANLIFIADSGNLEDVRKNLDQEKFYGILYIPASALENPEEFILYSVKKASLSVTSNLEDKLQREYENYSLLNAGIDPAVLKNVKSKSVSIKSKNINNNDEQANAGITAIVGFAGGLFIYMIIFIYGAQVMRGVMEEKSSRIVEVIMSSVKPFQLMMGKIIGISMVALTQILLWIILTVVVSGGITNYIASRNVNSFAKIQQTKAQQALMTEEQKQKTAELENFNIEKIIGNYNVPKILFCFIFYFIGGYLLYAALFAAIGAAVDSETDTQQFMLPITIPLIFAYIAATVVMQNPDSSLGYWCSLIPFTSPIVMMVRLPFDPPILDLVLSMLFLILGFIGTTWLASKVYRVGILMYGKKVSYKELAKWIMYKN